MNRKERQTVFFHLVLLFVKRRSHRLLSRTEYEYTRSIERIQQSIKKSGKF